MSRLVIACLVLGLCLTTIAAAPDVERAPASARPLRGVARPHHDVTMSPPLEGVLTEVRVAEGDIVAAGDVLAVMDHRVATAALRVAEGEASRTARIEHAAQEVTLQAWLVERLRTARGNDGANDYQFREAEIRLAQFRASHDAALEEKAQAMYQCDLAQARVEEHIIRAPFAGRVVRVHAQAGATLTTSDDLLTIVALDRLDAELHLPVTYYDRLRIGATYPLIASAPVGGVLHGRLRTAEPMIDPATRTFRCVFEIDNADGAHPAGFTVELDPRAVDDRTRVTGATEE